jgi:hypothetical protein
MIGMAGNEDWQETVNNIFACAVLVIVGAFALGEVESFANSSFKDVVMGFVGFSALVVGVLGIGGNIAAHRLGRPVGGWM